MNLVHTFKKNIETLERRKPLEFQAGLVPDWFGKAAVLILFWEENQTVKVVMTKRSADLSKHKGEVCFPGGKLEENENFIQAALREAKEEIGVDYNQIEIKGRLDDVWSGAAFHLVPVVGWYHGIPRFKKNDHEVDDILIIDLKELIYDTVAKDGSLDVNGVAYGYSILDLSVGTVFGLSADLLLEMVELGTEGKSSRKKNRNEELKIALKTDFFNR